MGWLQKLLSGKDNETPDLGRWSWVATTVAIIGFGVYLIATKGLDLLTFSNAMAINIGAHGAVIAAKAHTEPAAK